MHPKEFFLGFEAWPWWERDALAHVEGPVLDLGCGAGRHALHLQERGLEVVAVDHSPGAVDVCRRRGIVDARLGDLSDPPTDKKWRTVLLMCGNLGVAGGWDDTRRLLAELSTTCAEDAVVIADTVDPTETNDPRQLAHIESNCEKGRHRGMSRLRLRYREMVTPWWDQLNVPKAEMGALVGGTGWSVEVHLEDGIDHLVQLRRRLG